MRAGEDAAVDGRVQRFDAATENFGEAGQLLDGGYGQVGGAQGAGRAAAGDQLYVGVVQATGKVDEVGFVRNGK